MEALQMSHTFLRLQPMKRLISRVLFLLCPLTIVSSPVTGLAENQIQNGTPLSTIKSGETVYYEPEHVALPEPSFYTGNWQQWPNTVDKLLSIKHTAFQRKGNQVTYDALLSSKSDGFQEISRFKVVCAPPGNEWPNIKTSFFLIAMKKTYTEEWQIHKTWPNLVPKWQLDKSDPNKSAEQWLFVNLAENACYLTK
jgi:hypothetical protein